MKIVEASGALRIFSDDLVVHNRIPVGTYNVKFHPMMGYSLEKRSDLTVIEKVYGKHTHHVDRIVNKYQQTDRNLGVLLSGMKGMGKSLIARMLSVELLKQGIPTIVVTQNTPNIVPFLASIEQEVYILFDEFEKVFDCDNDGTDEQKQFLSLFDGLYNHKHLYVLTVNNTRHLNDYFLGRTGRLYYHFRFNHLKEDEIEAVIEDILSPEIDPKELYKAKTILPLIDLTYDQIFSILNEMNEGTMFEDVFEILNVYSDILMQMNHLQMIVTMSNGVVFKHGFVLSLKSTGYLDYVTIDDVGPDDKTYDFNFSGYLKRDDELFSMSNLEVSYYSVPEGVTVESVKFRKKMEREQRLTF